MKTNSPNPVDGDVQSYQMPSLTEQQREKQISFCEAVIKSSWADPLMVENCLISLAALTAEPIGFIHNYVNPGDKRSTSAISKEENRHHGRPVYLNPPAQILRPVELPESQRLCNGYYFDMNDVFEALEEAGIQFKVKS